MKAFTKGILIRAFTAAFVFMLLFALSALSEEPEPLYDRVLLIAEGEYPPPANLVSKGELMTQAEFEAIIKPIVESFQTGNIDVSHLNLPADTFYDMFQVMLNLNPELFYVSGGYWRFEDSNGNITSFFPIYKYFLEDGDDKPYNDRADTETIEALKKVFEKGVSDIVQYAKKADTQIGRMLLASDYMCVNYEYDTTYTYYYPIEFFEHKTGVCNAYCLSYIAVMKQLNIECTYTISESINHIWNLVKLDGNWYHIDVTWNDPIDDEPLRACHNNFLLSDAGVTASGHYGWETTIVANDTTYDNYFWKEIDHPFSMIGDTVYYTVQDEGLKRVIHAKNLKTKADTAVYAYDFIADGSYYSSTNPVWVTNHRIYYATRGKVYSVLWDGTNARAEYLAAGADDHVFYVYQSGDELKMYVRNVSGSGFKTSIPLEIKRDVNLNADILKMKENEAFFFTVSIDPEPSDKTVEWSSSDEAVAIVSPAGTLQTFSPGVSTVRCTFDDISFGECTVIVRSKTPLVIPGHVAYLEEDAFSGVGAKEIILPEGIQRIESGAFAACPDLRLLVLPEGEFTIEKDAFAYNPSLWILCPKGSFAEAYLTENALRFIAIADEDLNM